MSERKLTLADADQHDFDGLKTRVMELLAKGKSATYIAKATGQNYEKIRKIAMAEYEKQEAYKSLLKAEHVFGVNWIIGVLSDKISDDLDNKKFDRRDAELLLKWRDHNAKLHGHFAPTEHNVQVQVEDLSDDELMQQLKVAAPQLFVVQPTKSLPEPVEDAQFELHDTDQHERPAAEEAASDPQRE